VAITRCWSATTRQPWPDFQRDAILGFEVVGEQAPFRMRWVMAQSRGRRVVLIERFANRSSIISAGVIAI
jgi:hypothetical protein